jgi:hypothetical protein
MSDVASAVRLGPDSIIGEFSSQITCTLLRAPRSDNIAQATMWKLIGTINT